MLIKKFSAFERIDKSLLESEDYASITNVLKEEGHEVNEGILSSIRNYISKLTGGRVSKLDSLLKRYYDNEVDYWKNWADAQTKYNEADLLSKEAKSDPVEGKKYEEQKSRVLKLQNEVEAKHKKVLAAILKQVDLIKKDNSRLQDYWDAEKAKMDEKSAKDSYATLKNEADKETIDRLYDRVTQNVEAARKKDEEFKKKYSEREKEWDHDFDKKEVVSAAHDINKDIKNDPDMVTPVTVDELGGNKGVEDAVVQATVATADKLDEVPTATVVEDEIEKDVEKFFTEGKDLIEVETGNIPEAEFKHLKADLINLFGKLLIYYKQNQPASEKFDVHNLKIGLISFASKLYKWKKKKRVHARELTPLELENKFVEYEK